MNLLYVLIGSLAWIALHFAGSKKKYDNADKKFSLKIYAEKSYDDWIYTVIGGYVVYFGFPFLWAAYFQYHKEPVPELIDFYAPLCGFFGGFILQQLMALVGKIFGKK